MKEELAKLREEGEKAFREARTAEAVESARVKYLGRKGVVSKQFAKLGRVSVEERPEAGRLLNELKAGLSRELEEGRKRTKGKSARLRERLDVTIPGRRPERGRCHPVTTVLEEMLGIFQRLGFEVVEGPEVETVFYNFDGLNTAKYHPSRDLSDTFYITDDVVLRTHTSPVQIREMEKRKPPVRLVCPGRAYRPDVPDATHVVMHHQVEGLMVDRGVSFADLKGALDLFAKGMFGEDVKTRLLPDHFPFTEPSAQMEVSCTLCGGEGCEVCGMTGWIELLGCGMVHPNVLEGVGYDYEEFTGWAFGIGVERVAMRKYGIDDMRLFGLNDTRFLRQFRR